MNIRTSIKPDRPVQAARGVFVSGTDTGVGKTRVSVALIHALRDARHQVLGFKPVASGSSVSAQGWRNDDALALAAAGSLAVDYALINPYALPEPVAPHLAAVNADLRIELKPILDAYAALAANADWIVVEGAGGWRVPLNNNALFQAAIAQNLALPVILVVGLRLGCINHALLSAAAIRADGCRLLGWVGNAIDAAMPEREANLATLARLLDAPCLGVLEHRAEENPAQDAEQLRAAANCLILAARDVS